MRRVAARMFVVLLAAVLLWQTAGVRNALEIDPYAHCCGQGGVLWRPTSTGASPPRSSSHAVVRGCHGHDGTFAVLNFPSIVPPVGAPIPAPTPRRMAHVSYSVRFCDRLPIAVRPP